MATGMAVDGVLAGALLVIVRLVGALFIGALLASCAERSSPPS